jgi:CheY-like chemotaxis protein
MSAVSVVVVALNMMPAMCERLAGEGDLLTFADTEPIQALQAILEHRPRLIVLERLFAATPRGAALINRIKTDPQLARSEVRVMSHTGDYTRQVARPAGADAPAQADVVTRTGGDTSAATSSTSAATAEASRPLDWHGTRRAPRHRIRSGVEIQLDGNPADLVDLSIVGAQVLSATILRPNQKVRVGVPTEEFVMRFRGTIAWAKFELPRPAEPPRYRAGIEFTDADASAMEEFCARNRIS